jgi:NitT/TauT family transport system substrate-binding protein
MKSPMQSRRRFMASASVGAAALIGGTSASPADEGGPPETTTIRLSLEDASPQYVNCDAPLRLAKELLSAEGFADIRYIVDPSSELAYRREFSRGEIDFGIMFAPNIPRRLDAGVPITALAGMHSGCFELFAHEHIRTFSDLKGKRVGLGPGSVKQSFVSIMAAWVGLDPKTDIQWITTGEVAEPIDLFVQGRTDAYLAYVSESQDLRARNIGHVIMDMGRDKPFANCFCCMIVGHADFVRRYPVATKRALRAILKATDLCSVEPERAARRLVEGGFAQHYDGARQLLTDIPYASWRELDPEDTLRFYALWLYEFRELKSDPNKLIAKGGDWRFLEQIKRELKV